MFFYKNMMKAYISSDYVRGLSRLKEYMETGTILCQMSEVENVSQNNFYLVGKREKTSINELGPIMNKIFDGAMKDIETKKIPVPDGFISFYHNFDLVKAKTDFTCGVLYYQKPTVSNDYIVTEIPNHKNIKLTLQGTYNHLPTAWSKLWCFQKGKKVKIDKSISFYELYLNSPKMVAAKDVLTELRIPIK
jgi:predicted transcriptional regulator YdeE